MPGGANLFRIELEDKDSEVMWVIEKYEKMSIILTQFGVTTEDLRFSEVWSGNSYGLMRNATRKDFGGEA